MKHAAENSFVGVKELSRKNMIVLLARFFRAVSGIYIMKNREVR